MAAILRFEDLKERNGVGNYFGSKATSGLCQPIIAMMPPHDTYIETHLGGGAILRKKPPAARNIGVDIDRKTIAQFKSKFSMDYPVELIHGCAHHFLKQFDFKGSEMVYCDPPYLLSARTSARRYRFDYTERDHIELLDILKALPCHVILSGYPSALYNELLPNWRTMELQVMNQGGVRTEKLWHNFEINKVHWVKFAGKNFTDRQRIKRKAERWGKMYQDMPNDERLSVLAAIMEVESRDAKRNSLPV